jgi:hypothetical protein
MTKHDDLEDSELAKQSPQVARQFRLKQPFFITFKTFLGAISCYSLYLFLAKKARKRMPLLSGLGHLY